MPTKKIADLPSFRRCRHPEHKPPTMVVWEPGVYEHTCPSCGDVTRFIVSERPSMRDEHGYVAYRGGGGITPKWHAWNSIGMPSNHR